MKITKEHLEHVKQLGVEKEYKTSFQKISAEDAVVIGRRSQSFTTKEKIDKIISKMESDLSSTTKQKEHAHG